MRRTVATLLALACLFPRAALAVDHIAFTTGPDGSVEVQASVDGQPPVPMLVDLGAGIDVFSTPIGNRDVLVNGKYVTLRLNGQRVDLPFGNIVSLTLDGVTVEAPHVGIWKGLDAEPFDGLISATAFRNEATTFDFRNHEIVIEDAMTFPDRRRTALRIPLTLQDDLGVSLELFAVFDFGNGKTGLCEIDTGSQHILVDRSFAGRLGITSVSSLALAGAPQTAVARPNVAFADLIYDCSVGNDFWTRRAFTLDLPNRAMYVALPT